MLHSLLRLVGADIQPIYCVLDGAFGNRYRVPGAVVGELELISVSDDQSKAILVEGTGAVPGNSVSLK